MAKTVSWLLLALALVLVLISLSLALTKIIGVDCDSYHSNLVLERSEITVRVGEGRLVKGYIENKGFEDELKLSVKGEGVVIRPEKVRIEKDEKEEVFVYISPYKKGNYTAEIRASSYCQNLESVLRINVE